MNVLGALWAKVLQLIDFAAKLVVVGVPALYFMGWSYLEKYWEKLGVSDTLLGLSTPDYLRSGAMVLMVSFIELAPWVVRLMVACLVAVCGLIFARVFFLRQLSFANRSDRTAEERKKKDASKRLLPRHRHLARTLDGLVETISSGSIALLVSFAFFAGLIALGIKPSQDMAEKDAATKLRAVSRAAVEEDNWLLAHSEAAPGRAAHVVQCGGEVCVVLTGERTEAWPRSSITRMETCRRVGKADDGTFHCITRTALL